MAWIRQSAFGDNEAMLGEALDAVLQSLVENADETGKVRLERLRERLTRPPVPTGLVREVHSLLSMLSGQAGPRSADTSEVIAAMSRSMADALQASALLDFSLGLQIDELASAIPPKVGRADARRIGRDADEIRQAAIPVRRKALAERHESHRMVQDLVAEIAPTMRHWSAMDWGISELGSALRDAYEPELMRSMRGEIIGLVRDLAGNAGALRGQLERTHQKVEQLESRLAAQQRALKDARESADRDPLTSLFNRGAFDRYLLEAVRVAREDETPVALVLLDMDHFKSVNDQHGHPAGDQVLRALATCLRAHVRGEDLVARVGGEEFALVLQGATTTDVLAAVERVRKAIEGKLFRSDNGEFSVTVSAGVAHIQPFEGPLAFYKRADKALYDAKNSGRNRYVVAA
ncbi:MAG: two-component system cell cycle response regulator [Kiritimatiellia bacterium]|jgi:two-component system cell cycle response regulator